MEVDHSYAGGAAEDSTKFMGSSPLKREDVHNSNPKHELRKRSFSSRTDRRFPHALVESKNEHNNSQNSVHKNRWALRLRSSIPGQKHSAQNVQPLCIPCGVTRYTPCFPSGVVAHSGALSRPRPTKLVLTKATVGGVPPFSLVCLSHSHE